MFAQLSSVAPDFFWQFAIVVGFLLSTIASVFSVLASRRVQRRDVTLGEDYVTKNLCSSYHSQNTLRIQRIEAEIDAIRNDSKTDREKFHSDLINEVGKVHNRINQVLEAVSELRGEVRHRKLN